MLTRKARIILLAAIVAGFGICGVMLPERGSAAKQEAEAESGDPEEKILQRLNEHVEGQDGELLYAALYGLPQTRAIVEKAAGGATVLAAYPPAQISELLSAAEKERALRDVARELANWSATEQQQFLLRVYSWITIKRMLDLSGRIGDVGVEEMAAALFMVPETKECFWPMLQHYGSADRAAFEAAKPGHVGAALSSGSHSELQFRVLEKLSTLSPRERVESFRDLFSAILEVQEMRM